MADWVIKVDGISKRYHIAAAQNMRNRVTFREMLIDRCKGLFEGSRRVHQTSEDFWALRDISFEVKQGEACAIIGRNGAGKSTMLKILSRITEPTRGIIRLKGRVASLLEVGTGFHSELTGRENIYLNGIILGMTKKEIDRKLDAIIDFSGVEQFIDTPVKRFSSGMQVRLAFAVAAHLEPEILIIDEVLAVGDASFQKKCLGKMQEVATDGRTVLFVSHDLAAVEKLCKRAILLDKGRCEADGTTSHAIAQYQAGLIESASSGLTTRVDRKGAGTVRFTKIQLLDGNGIEQSVFLSGRPLRVRMHYRSSRKEILQNSRVSLTFNGWGTTYFLASTELHRTDSLNLASEGFIDCVVDELPLSLGTYYLGPFLEVNGVIEDWLDSSTVLHVEDGNFYGTGKDYPIGWEGKTVLVKHRWEQFTSREASSDTLTSQTAPKA
jgi:lipopolysaccharide transport system ATP-binding protein